MFWGLIMEPQRRYTQVVKKSFHISMAALDISTSNEEPAQVMCGFEGRNYLLCTLEKPNMVQCPLDLNFEVGSEVSFATNGKCHIHLTGYLTDDVLPGVDDEEDEEEEEAEGEEVEEDEADTIAQLKGKRQNAKVLNGPPAKKVKSEKVTSTQPKTSDEDEDDSDDSDVDMSQLLLEESDDSDDEENADDSDDEEEGEEEDDEEDNEDDEEDDDDDDLSSMSEVEEEDVILKSKSKDKKAKLNGDIKKADIKSQKANASPQKQNNENKTPKSEKKRKAEKQQNAEQKTPGKDQKKTPMKEQQNKKEQQQQLGRTPGKEGKTPGKEGKTPGKDGKTPGKEQNKTPGKEQGKTPKKKTVQGGVIIEDIVEGSGDMAKQGKHVHVYYEGRFRDNNKMFDSTTKGSGFGFRLGKGEVIKGWDVGVLGMKMGGKRRITCPPGMAYGTKGCPPEIPPNSTLVFEVELKKIS